MKYLSTCSKFNENKWFPKTIKEDGVIISPFRMDDVMYNQDKFIKINRQLTNDDINRHGDSPGGIYILIWEGHFIPARIIEIKNDKILGHHKNYIGYTIEGDKFNINDGSTLYDILDLELKEKMNQYFLDVLELV
jgi:hypothetical protein